MTTELYFIAILAPADIDQHIIGWKKYMLQYFNCKVALRSPAHITLIPPFRAEKSKEDELVVQLDTFAKQRNDFEVSIRNFSCFPPRVIYADVEKTAELEEIRTAIGQFFLSDPLVKIKSDSRPFHPHITIANRDLRKQDFKTAWAHFQVMQYEAKFVANAVSLLRNSSTGWQIAASCPFGNNLQ